MLIKNQEFKFKLSKFKNKQITQIKICCEMIQSFHEDLRQYFNIIQTQDSITFTLINPNIDSDIMREMHKPFKFNTRIKKEEIIIIDNPIFDDELLVILAEGLSQNLSQLVLDFSGCESLKGSGFLQLFQKISGMSLRKFHLDVGQVYDIDDVIMQGLSMLLSSLEEDLQDLFFDGYQLSRITQEGFSNMKKLTKLHLDFSANPNLNEDSLELLFGNLCTPLKQFTFRILDIQQIAGGSFFKLAEAMSKMADSLEYLSLTFSSFTSINFDAISSVLTSISSMKQIKQIQLNFSDLNLPTKIFQKFQIPQTVKKLKLDLSCNRKLTDLDVVNLIDKTKRIQQICFNFDFCDKISEDSIQQLCQELLKGKDCYCLQLLDRACSKSLTYNLIEKAAQKNRNGQFFRLLIVPSEQSTEKWIKYKEYEALKRNIIFVTKACRIRNIPLQGVQGILNILF